MCLVQGGKWRRLATRCAARTSRGRRLGRGEGKVREDLRQVSYSSSFSLGTILRDSENDGLFGGKAECSDGAR